MSDYGGIKFGQLAICGCSTSFIIFSTGVACLVISIWNFSQYGWNVNCGFGGKPPLLKWVFGTGVAFLIITCAFARVSTGKDRKPAMIVLGCSNCFIFIWAIVGSFSLWKWGGACEIVNPHLYRMGYAGVIISFILCCCGGFVGYRSYDEDEAEMMEAAREEPVATDDEKDNNV